MSKAHKRQQRRWVHTPPPVSEPHLLTTVHTASPPPGPHGPPCRCPRGFSLPGSPETSPTGSPPARLRFVHGGGGGGHPHPHPQPHDTKMETAGRERFSESGRARHPIHKVKRQKKRKTMGWRRLGSGDAWGRCHEDSRGSKGKEKQSILAEGREGGREGDKGKTGRREEGVLPSAHVPG